MVREERINFLHAVELQLQILFSPLFLYLLQSNEEGTRANAIKDYECMSELASLIKLYIFYFQRIMQKLIINYFLPSNIKLN